MTKKSMKRKKNNLVRMLEIKRFTLAHDVILCNFIILDRSNLYWTSKSRYLKITQHNIAFPSPHLPRPV